MITSVYVSRQIRFRPDEEQVCVHLFNPFASGIKKVLLYPITGLFSVKIQKKFLAIKNFSVNDTMSGQPNKRLIH